GGAGEAGQQVWGLAVEIGRPSEQAAAMEASRQQLASLLQPGVRALPQLIGHDALIWSVDTQPLICLATVLLLRAAADDLLAPIPDNDTAVQLPVQHFPDTGDRPAVAAAGRCDVVLV